MNASDDKTDDYKVGYCQPPRHSQFAKGKSGNPKGRPKKVQTLATLFDKALRRKVNVTRNGQQSQVMVQEILPDKIIELAFKGNKHAMLLLLQHVERSAPVEEVVRFTLNIGDKTITDVGKPSEEPYPATRQLISHGDGV